ncbi:MAG: GNAT family N-acetyltransferase, partial [Rhodospirillales bacterium]|nr:GNAT family N-acetyltransferase [Rhodospirillales bacterium]
MSTTTAPLAFRPLGAADLDAVVAIDRGLSGRPRGAFFDRRLAQLAREPAAFAAFAAERGGKLAGYAFARLYQGEFGDDRREAALDAIGVATAGEGIGRALLAHLIAHLRGVGVAALTTEVDWRDPALLGFFARNGFDLAPRLVLARPVLGAVPGEDAFAEDAAAARDRLP